MTELTDAEILETYGPLFEEASGAFRNDINYLLNMADAAGARHQRNALRREAAAETREQRNALRREAARLQKTDT